MFRILTLSAIILLFSDIAFAAIKVPQEPQNVVQIADKTLPRDLKRLEDTFFNQDFKDETQTERLNRLEYRAFGALQDGTNEDRVKRLKKASLAYRSQRVIDLENEFYPYYDNYSVPNYTTRNGLRGVFRNLNNFFGGVPTGMTPPVYYPPNIYPNSYNSYSNNNPYLFNNGNSRYVRTNRGWYYNNSNASSGTGVTILD